MDSSPNNPWAAPLAKVCVIATLFLIFIGAIVTTAGAGMAAPNAPHVGGSLINPVSPLTGGAWYNDPALFKEHSHRLAAMTVGLGIGALCAMLWRNWLAFAVAVAFMGVGQIGRKFGLSDVLVAQLRVWPAMVLFVTLLIVGARRRGEKPGVEAKLALVGYIAACIQAALGTLRVEIETGGNLALATNIRTFHGVFAQAFLVLIVILAARLSPVWQSLSGPHPAAAKIRRMAIIGMILYFAQLACAAYLRHRPGLWQAIASWPAAQGDPGFSAGGSWLPAAWSHAVGIHFLHTRVLPVLLAGHLLGMGFGMLKRAAGTRLAPLGLWVIAAVVAQFALGVLMFAFATRAANGHPQAHITNTHVVLGALLIALIALVFARAGRLQGGEGKVICN